MTTRPLESLVLGPVGLHNVVVSADPLAVVRLGDAALPYNDRSFLIFGLFKVRQWRDQWLGCPFVDEVIYFLATFSTISCLYSGRAQRTTKISSGKTR